MARHVEDLRALDLFLPSGKVSTAVQAVCSVFLSEADVWLPTSSWLRALGALGLGGATVRSGLRSLADGGYLVSEIRGGVAGYGVSPALGRLMANEAVADRHDERWLLVTVRVPEVRRDLRSQLRQLLVRGNFGSLSGGLWVGRPHQATRAAEYSEVLGANDYVDLFVAEHLGPRGAAGLVERCWDLSAIAGRYRDCAAVVARARRSRSGGGEAAFVRVIEVARAWSTALGGDPGLPWSVIPNDWPDDPVGQAVNAVLAKDAASARAWLTHGRS